MAKFEIDIGRMMDAFTKGTYKTHQALYELIDNSEAADASEIYITAEKGGNDPISRIIVSDNGVGMTPQKLIKSLKFAGDRERDITEISQYGVGMKAASFAMAREVAVITKTEDGSVCGAFLSRDRLRMDPAEYEGPFDAAKSRNYEQLWENYSVGAGDCGTIVVLDKIRDIEYASCGTFIGNPQTDGKKASGLHLHSRIATRYHDKIFSGSLKIFTVRGHRGSPQEIKGFDPLLRDVDSTEIIIDNVPFCAPPKFSNAKFDISLTRTEQGSSNDFGIYIKIAGIVVAKDNTAFLGIYTANASHSYHWQLRGEVSFATKAEFDKVMIATSHKHNYQLKNQDFGDWIRDQELGRKIVAEALRREKSIMDLALVKKTQKRSDYDSALVNMLNVNRDVYGSSRHLKEFRGKITGIKDGHVTQPGVISELVDGVIICNTGHQALSRIINDNHKLARIEAVAEALVNAASKQPSREEERQFRLNLYTEL